MAKNVAPCRNRALLLGRGPRLLQKKWLLLFVMTPCCFLVFSLTRAPFFLHSHIPRRWTRSPMWALLLFAARTPLKRCKVPVSLVVAISLCELKLATLLLFSRISQARRGGRRESLVAGHPEARGPPFPGDGLWFGSCHGGTKAVPSRPAFYPCRGG